MPSSQFTEWMEFYRLEPFGARWQNWLMAQPLQFSRLLHSKKGHRPPIDDLYYKDTEERVQEGNATLHDLLRRKAKKKTDGR